MKVMNTAQIMEEIANHQLNFGLIEAPVNHPDMHMEAVMSDELKLIVPASASACRFDGSRRWRT